MGSESWFAYAFPSPSENSQEIKYPSHGKPARIFTDTIPEQFQPRMDTHKYEFERWFLRAFAEHRLKP
jgi:hypothetical protein